MQFSCSAENIYKPPEKSREELYQDIFISLLLPHIQKPIDNYYTEFLTEPPVVYGYNIDVINAERMYGYRNFAFLLKLEVYSVVGPHIGVGIDRLTFEIGTGKVELKQFEHVKTYDLPEHWEHIIK
jgi:hypothetical protein